MVPSGKGMGADWIPDITADNDQLGISSEQIPSVDFLLYIIENRIIPISNDGV